MSVVYHFRHKQLGIENTIILRNHASRHGKCCREDSGVEEYSSVWCDLKVKEKIGIEH